MDCQKDQIAVMPRGAFLMTSARWRFLSHPEEAWKD